MTDLFSKEEPKTKKSRIKSSLFCKPGEKPVYKAMNGKFTDKETARLANIEKERNLYKKSSEYWKRQAERLSEDYKTEHEKRLELEKQLKTTPNI